MSARQGVVVLVNPEEEGEIVRAIDQTSGLKVVRRCADLAEARAAIRAKVAALVVLDMSDPDLDAITIDELHRFGAGVILVADPEDTAPARSLGADGLCARGLPSMVVDSLLALLRSEDAEEGVSALPLPPPPPDSESQGDELHLLEQALLNHEAGRFSQAQDRGGRKGHVIAVWGTSGAPGRSTIALGLAHALAKKGEVLIVDADTKDPSIAHMSGVPVDASGLAALARRVVRGGLDARAVRESVVKCAPGLFLLTGLASPHRWREAGPAAIVEIIETARCEFEWILVDVPAISPDTMCEEVSHQGSQDDSAAAVLANADEIVCVARADVIGVNRLSFAVEWLADQLPEQHARIVVNRVAPCALGSRPHNALDAALSGIVPGARVHIVPEDEAVATGLLEGRSVVVNTPKSPAAKAIEALADQIAPSKPSSKPKPPQDSLVGSYPSGRRIEARGRGGSAEEASIPGRRGTQGIMPEAEGSGWSTPGERDAQSDAVPREAESMNRPSLPWRGFLSRRKGPNVEH